MRDYVRAVLVELQMHRHTLTGTLRTIYIGGGTPSLLGSDNLALLLEPLTPMIDNHTEFTLEANPDSLSSSLARTLRTFGVNRVSLGVQSLIDEELQTLGRIHNAKQALHAFDILQQAGIANIGADLIYGIPGQTPDSWQESLDGIINTNPCHVSTYALSFENGTPLGEDLSSGKVVEMSEELQKECYMLARTKLANAGLPQYEISNFSRPDRRCVMSLTYWHNLSYLGLGPSAASFIGGTRRTNHADINTYMQSMNQRRPCPHNSERLTMPMSMAETLMLALRMTNGIERKELIERFGTDPVDVFQQSIDRYASMGMLIVNDRLQIAEDALFVSNSILTDIIQEALRLQSPPRRRCQ